MISVCLMNEIKHSDSVYYLLILIILTILRVRIEKRIIVKNVQNRCSVRRTISKVQMIFIIH